MEWFEYIINKLYNYVRTNANPTIELDQKINNNNQWEALS